MDFFTYIHNHSRFFLEYTALEYLKKKTKKKLMVSLQLLSQFTIDFHNKFIKLSLKERNTKMALGVFLDFYMGYI